MESTNFALSVEEAVFVSLPSVICDEPERYGVFELLQDSGCNTRLGCFAPVVLGKLLVPANQSSPIPFWYRGGSFLVAHVEAGWNVRAMYLHLHRASFIYRCGIFDESRDRFWHEKKRGRQLLARLYSAGLKDFLVVFPEEVATINVFCGHLENEVN